MGQGVAKNNRTMKVSKPEPAHMFGVLTLIQVAACAVILWKGVPFYRSFVDMQEKPDPHLVLTMLACSLIIQLSYWKAIRFRESVSVSGPVVLSHILQFASRLVFIFPSALFSLVFIDSAAVLNLGVIKLGLLILLLFSVYCFTQHIDWIARMMRRKH